MTTTDLGHYHPDTFSQMVFDKKYRGNKETIYDVFNASVDSIFDLHAKRNPTFPLRDSLVNDLRDALYGKRFIYGGRILAAFGSEKDRKLSYYNCTSINILEDTWEGISEAAYKVGKVSSRGQGVGIDFSVLRPRMATVNNAARSSTGAVSFMRYFDALGNTLVQDGDSNSPGRRLALLFTLSVSHPDIEEFINCKNEKDSITNANISVLISEAFINAVKNDTSWDLVFDGQVYKTVRAKELMLRISESNRISAEPGVLFMENMIENALPNELGFPIVGVNACTEAVLDYAGVCNLGSLNLGSYHAPFQSKYQDGVDWDLLKKDVQAAVFALDSIVSLEEVENRAPIVEQTTSQSNLRRIGLGVMGLADLLALSGIKYGSKKAIKFTDKLMQFITNEAFKASSRLARYLGTFGAISKRNGFVLKSTREAVDLTSHPFIARLDEDTKESIRMYGLRNSAIISIAPTGSISNLVGCTSGVEPLYRKSYTRFTRLNGDWESIDYVHPVYERSKDFANTQWVEANEVSPMDKLAMISTIQKWVDQSISNTGNFPAETTAEDIQEYYFKAFKSGAKGLTVYVENDITRETRGAVLSETTPKERSEEIREEEHNVDTTKLNYSDFGMSMFMGSSCRIGEDGEPKCD